MDTRLRAHPAGFLTLANPPTAEELTEYYSRRYYQTERGSYRHIYSPDELAVKSQRIELRASRALQLRDCSRPGRILDVGCGEGFVLAHFERAGWEVAGIDFSVKGVKNHNPDIAAYVQQGDVFSLLEKNMNDGAKYDLVWLQNVLEHVLDPVNLLRSLHSLVADGGVLVVTVPNDGNVFQERLYADGLVSSRWWVAVPDHISYFTAESLSSIAVLTGWACNESLGDFPIDWFLAHPGSNYVENPHLGPDAHQARLRLEAAIRRAGPDAANRFYSALADLGLGRNITGFLMRDKS